MCYEQYCRNPNRLSFSLKVEAANTYPRPAKTRANITVDLGAVVLGAVSPIGQDARRARENPGAGSVVLGGNQPGDPLVLWP